MSGRRRVRWTPAALGPLIPAAAVLAAWLWLAPLSHAQVTFSAPASFPADGSPVSIALGDFNGDGDPDVAATTAGSVVSVLLGGAGGSFGPPTAFAAGDNPGSVAVGDFNADADPDLAIADIPNKVRVLLGGPGGSFGPATAFAAGAYPSSVAVGDFNADGDPDLAVTTGSEPFDDGVSVLLGGPGGTFGPATTFGAFVGDGGPDSIAVGDFNADADPDFALSNSHYSAVEVLLGGAGGTFGPPTAFATGEESDESPVGDVAVGDFNGDADPDLAVTRYGSDYVSVLLGGAGGSFGPATAFAASKPNSVAVGDFNGDADPDLAVANYDSNSVSVLLGGAGGTFGPAMAFAAGDGPFSVAAGYLNSDSKLDLAVAGDAVRVLINTTDASAPPQRPDPTPPETTITSGPAGRTRDRAPRFGFSSNEAGSTFECRVDTGATRSCSSPYRVIGLSEGPHTFQVRATDAAGNTDPSPASRRFTVVSIADALSKDARSAARALGQLGIRKLVRKGGFTVATFDALVAGTLTVRVAAREMPSGARAARRSIIIAEVRRSFPVAGSYRVRVALTRAGRLFLWRARRIRVTLTMRFSHSAGTARRATNVLLKRSPGARRKPATLSSG